MSKHAHPTCDFPHGKVHLARNRKIVRRIFCRQMRGVLSTWQNYCPIHLKKEITNAWTKHRNCDLNQQRGNKIAYLRHPFLQLLPQTRYIGQLGVHHSGDQARILTT